MSCCDAKRISWVAEENDSLRAKAVAARLLGIAFYSTSGAAMRDNDLSNLLHTCIIYLYDVLYYRPAGMVTHVLTRVATRGRPSESLSRKLTTPNIFIKMTNSVFPTD